MKVLDIALKDMNRYFRSTFALGMMFVAPLLITGLLYFAFGSQGKEGSKFNLPVTRVQVANLDQPAPQAQLAAGQMLVDILQGEQLADVLQMTIAPDEMSARAAVDRREVDAAVIIPADFTSAALTPGAQAAVTLYHDPAHTIGPGIVKTFLSDTLDGFAGIKIAIQVSDNQMRARGLAISAASAQLIEQSYIAWLQGAGHTHGGEPASPMVTVRSPEGGEKVADPLNQILGPIMAGMMITFVFFTGASSTSAILQEEQDGTLARLFTTPTTPVTVLSGKIIAVLLILVAQSFVLVLASSLIFGLSWGKTPAVVMAAAGMVIAASGFGMFLISFVKSMQQAGPVMGSVTTLTAMLGGLFTTPIPDIPPAFEVINLTMPQGWALRAWRLALAGAGSSELLLPTAILLVMGLVLFLAGVLVIRRRFA